MIFPKDNEFHLLWSTICVSASGVWEVKKLDLSLENGSVPIIVIICDTRGVCVVEQLILTNLQYNQKAAVKK